MAYQRYTMVLFTNITSLNVVYWYEKQVYQQKHCRKIACICRLPVTIMVFILRYAMGIDTHIYKHLRHANKSEVRER